MPEYTITPTSDPGWALDPAILMRELQDRWPEARVQINPPDAPMAANALIPFHNERGELGVALDQMKYAVVLDPADPDSAAEFIDWYRTRIPSFHPNVLIITEDYETSMILNANTDRAEAQSFLSTAAA